MPTNLLRKTASEERSDTVEVREQVSQSGGDDVLLTIGRVRLIAHLNASETCARIRSALPLYGMIETWGQAIHFELPIRSGRDRSARLNGVLGDLYFWPDEGRIILPFGATPISGRNEIRLPCPCNVLGRIEGDLTKLQKIQPATKVSLTKLSNAGG